MVRENIKTVEQAGGIWALAGGFGRGILLAVAFTLIVFAVFACILAYTAVSDGAIPVIATVTEAIGALELGVTFDAVNVCADCAIDALLELTGEKATATVVDEVFSRFCVGR